MPDTIMITLPIKRFTPVVKTVNFDSLELKFESESPECSNS